MAWCNKLLNISFQFAVNLSIFSEVALAVLLKYHRLSTKMLTEDYKIVKVRASQEFIEL